MQFFAKQAIKTSQLAMRSSRLQSTSPLLAASQAKRNISLLINDQFLNEDQKMIQQMAYDFAKAELEPHAAEWDRTKHFPVDKYKLAAEQGFAGIYVSEENGGCGLGRTEASLIFEALSTGCVGSSAYISIHNMCAWMIDVNGTKE